MIKIALALRHVHFEDLGAFRPVLEARGFNIRYVEVGTDDLGGLDAASPDLMVVLGGPIGAYEEDRYPVLIPELQLIGERLATGRPLLGLCLGAQLMARAMGAAVRRGAEKEIGWGPVQLTEAGRAGPLAHLDSVPVLHWHGDVLDLPDGAVCLASTGITPNQAFARGPAALGIQFHPEAEVAGFERWLIGHAAEIAEAGLSPEILRHETAEYGPASAERGRLMFADWLAGLGL
jgi:GMP synthase (glutamine-hydrolysing)